MLIFHTHFMLSKNVCYINKRPTFRNNIMCFKSKTFQVRYSLVSKKWTFDPVLTLRISRKYGEQAESTTLCALRAPPSALKVMSTKSSTAKSSLNVVVTFD